MQNHDNCLRRSWISLLLLVALGTADAHAQRIVRGDSVALGDGMAWVWVEVDDEDAPVRIGVDHGSTLPHYPAVAPCSGMPIRENRRSRTKIVTR